MVYAIIKTGGKQIKLKAGDNIWIEKIAGEQGEQVILKDVLAIYDDKQLHLGKPLLTNASIAAIVVKQGKGPKIKILRFKEKSNWERRQGHRQPYTKLLISYIKLNDQVISKIEFKIQKEEQKNSPKQIEESLPKQVFDDEIKQDKIAE